MCVVHNIAGVSLERVFSLWNKGNCVFFGVLSYLFLFFVSFKEQLCILLSSGTNKGQGGKGRKNLGMVAKCLKILIFVWFGLTVFQMPSS